MACSEAKGVALINAARISSIPITELRAIPAFRKTLDVWRQLCGPAFAPPWRAFDLVHYPHENLPYMTVVDVEPAREDFTYRYWGSGHVETKGVDLTGCSVLEHRPKDFGKLLFAGYLQVVAKRRPVGFRHDLRQADRHAALLYQDTLRMPLSSNGEIVTHVVSFADWRSRLREWRQVFNVPPS